MINPLDPHLSLIEIKVPGKVIRVMAYHKERYVLPFDFDGHQGSNKISRSDMERAKKLAAEASRVMDELEKENS